MDVRRLFLVKDIVHAEGGLPAIRPITRVAACAVIANPLAGQPTDNLETLIPFGEELGECLVKECLSQLSKPAVAYGKAAIVGGSGDIEHAAAILHPRMGKPMRAALGGGLAIIPSNVKIGGLGAEIDVPLGHKDDVWSFDQIDTLTVMVPNAPRADEIVVIVALSDGGRPRPRVSKAGAIPPALM
jgi:hypothetical protein